MNNLKKIEIIDGIPIYLNIDDDMFLIGEEEFWSFSQAKEFAERIALGKKGFIMVKMGSDNDAPIEVFKKEEVIKRGWLPIGENLYYPITKKEAIKQGWYKTDCGTWGYDPYPLC